MLALARDKRMINCMLSGPLGLGTDLSTVLERHLKNHFIDDVIVLMETLLYPLLVRK